MGRLLSTILGLAMLLLAIVIVPSRSTVLTNLGSWVPSRPIISPFADSVLFAVSFIAATVLLGIAAAAPSRQARLNQIGALRDRMVALRISLEQDQQGLISVEEGERQYRDLQDAIAYQIRKLQSAAEERIFRTKGNITRRISTHPHQKMIDFCIHDIDHLKDFVKDYSRRKG